MSRPTATGPERTGPAGLVSPAPEAEALKPFLISLAAGVLVGVLYALLNVRSPAPPLVALAGLLGILLGERAVSAARARLDPPTQIQGLAPPPGPVR